MLEQISTNDRMTIYGVSCEDQCIRISQEVAQAVKDFKEYLSQMRLPDEKNARLETLGKDLFRKARKDAFFYGLDIGMEIVRERDDNDDD